MPCKTYKPFVSAMQDIPNICVCNERPMNIKSMHWVHIIITANSDVWVMVTKDGFAFCMTFYTKSISSQLPCASFIVIINVLLYCYFLNSGVNKTWSDSQTKYTKVLNLNVYQETNPHMSKPSRTGRRHSGIVSSWKAHDFHTETHGQSVPEPTRCGWFQQRPYR